VRKLLLITACLAVAGLAPGIPSPVSAEDNTPINDLKATERRPLVADKRKGDGLLFGWGRRRLGVGSGACRERDEAGPADRRVTC